MKSYRVVLSDDLSNIYEDIARVNKKKVEECLSIILERVIRTMVHPSRTDRHDETSLQK